MTVETMSQQPKFFVLDQSNGTAAKFIEGTTAIVTLTNEIGQEVFKKTFVKKEELLDFIKNHVISFSGYSPALATFIPPRTETWEGLAKDVFFPTLVNHSLKQEGVYKKACGSFIGLSLDLLTLIPRIAATPFRMLYNSNIQRSDHPLVNVLKDIPDAISSIKNGYLIAHIDMQIVKIEEKECEEEDWKHFSATVKTRKISQPIITNYNSPCPIQEEVEVQISNASYSGGKRKSDGHAYMPKGSRNSDSNKSTIFHFFCGLDEHATMNSGVFSDL